MGKIKEIVINNKSHTVIEDGIPVYEYNRSETTSSIKINGEDPFKNGSPIILKSDNEEFFEAWDDCDVYRFLERNNIRLIEHSGTLLKGNYTIPFTEKINICFGI